jgi:hypothetical protein
MKIVILQDENAPNCTGQRAFLYLVAFMVKLRILSLA